MTQRRRGEELETALLEAAWDELAENGYGSFTMEAVAARAQTSRPVLYRRWRDRHELVRAAIGWALERQRPQVPDTGSLRGDVLALMRDGNRERLQMVTMLSTHLGGYYRETGTNPNELKSMLLAGRVPILDTIFERAIARGEVDAGSVTERMRTLPFDLLRQELLMTLAPVPDRVIKEIVDDLFLPLVLARVPVA